MVLLISIRAVGSFDDCTALHCTSILMNIIGKANVQLH